MALRTRSMTQHEIVDDVVIQVSTQQNQKAVQLNLPLPLPPTQFKFLSYSLPNSAYSSPRFSSLQCGGQSHLIPRQKVDLNRSKSCGEGRARAPHDDLDIWQQKPNSSTLVVAEKGHKHKTHLFDYLPERCWKTEREWRRSGGKAGRCGEVVRCGALCLLLRGFGKGKGEREREREREEEEEEEEEEGGNEGSGGGCISRRVSLEKFECGSWASSGMVVHEDGESGSLYFDLPIELIRNSVGAQARTQTPVQAAFVFDNNGKEVGTKGKAEESAGGNVLRLRKPIEELNALILLELEAQSGY